LASRLDRDLFRHGTVYAASRVAGYAVVYALLPVYAHLLGDAGLGAIEILATASAVLTLLFLQGLGGAWLRLRFDQPDRAAVRGFEATLFWYLAATTAAATGLLLVAGDWLAPAALPGVPFWPLGALAVGAAALLVPVRLAEIKLQAEQRPAAYAALSIVRAAVTGGAIAVAIVGLDRGVRGKLEAELLAVGLTAAVAIAIVLRPGRPARGRLGPALAYGLPLLPHGLAVLLNNLIDRVILGAMLGLGPTGVYGFGFQIAYAPAIAAIALNQAFAPLFIRAVKRAEQAEAAGDDELARAQRTLLARAAVRQVATVAVLALAAAAAAPFVIELLAPASFADAETVIAPIAGASIAWACYFPFSQAILQQPRSVRLMPLITGAAAALNIAGNLVLIPELGIDGAAWATLGSNAVMALLAAAIGQRATPLPLPASWLTVLAASAGGLATIALVDLAVVHLAVVVGAALLFRMTRVL
jgi:O-antigen/teichoic acid export membrane protein